MLTVLLPENDRSAGGSVSASVSIPAGVRRLRQPMNTCPSYTEE